MKALRRNAGLLILLAFWGVMNVFLWHREYGGGAGWAGGVPSSLVWERILTAPDNSSLEIRKDGRRIGMCRWIPRIVEAETEAMPTIDGMVRDASGYGLRISGRVLFDRSLGGDIDFDANLATDADRSLTTLALTLEAGDVEWEVHVDFQASTLRIHTPADASGTEQFVDFSQPAGISNLLDGLGVSAFVPVTEMALGTGALGGALGRVWTASFDEVRFGAGSVRAYRLEAALTETWVLIVFVSQVGEIIRAEFPGDIVLVNDALVLL